MACRLLHLLPPSLLLRVPFSPLSSVFDGSPDGVPYMVRICCKITYRVIRRGVAGGVPHMVRVTYNVNIYAYILSITYTANPNYVWYIWYAIDARKNLGNFAVRSAKLEQLRTGSKGS